MSVCRKLPDGTIQKIAGHTILLDANASEVREGNITIPISMDNEYVGTVTFSDPMPDNDYVVVLNISAWNSDGNIYGTPYRIDNKTTTGFKIRGWKAGSSQTTQITFEWIAFKLVKLDGYTALQNKVENPDDTPTIDSMNLVTSDGVARAIENASAVWKGTKTEWNALPATTKIKYDLAVLLDVTLVKAVDREDGTETDVANLNKIVHLTKAEYDAMPSHDPDTYYMITDDTTIHQPVLDWENKVLIPFNLTQSDSWTVPSDGMIIGVLRSVDYSTLPAGVHSYIYLYINDVLCSEAEHIKDQFGYSGSVQLPVAKGDVIRRAKTDNYPTTNVLSFIPWK